MPTTPPPPFKTPDDLKAKKVRVFGKTLGEAVKVWGGAPALISGSEQFLAYQRGTVDAGMTGLTTIEPRKLHQVMDHLSVTQHSDIEFICVINEKAWRSLTDHERDVMVRAARVVEKKLRDNILALEDKGLAFAKKHMTVVEPTKEDMAKWRNASKPVLDGYLKASGELGGKIVAETRKLQ